VSVVVFELRRTIEALDRLGSRDLERILEAGTDSPRIRAADDTGPAGGVEHIVQALAMDRSRKHLTIESLQALLDTVATALIVLKAAGGVTLVNRAAYKRRRMFVSATGFSSPGNEPERLLALQAIAGQSDAVELGFFGVLQTLVIQNSPQRHSASLYGQ
jgi:hypothetical protein